MNEPTMIRCARCDAIVAIQDAAKCAFHGTAALCNHCMSHHLAKHEAEKPPWWEACWIEAALPLTWR